VYTYRDDSIVLFVKKSAIKRVDIAIRLISAVLTFFSVLCALGWKWRKVKARSGGDFCLPVFGIPTQYNVFVSALVGRNRRLKIKFLLFIYLHTSKDNSVSIVFGYGLDDRAIEVRSPAEATGFLL
jgi:hypothetical protein